MYFIIFDLFSTRLMKMFFGMKIILIWILIIFIIKGNLVINVLAINNFRFTDEVGGNMLFIQISSIIFKKLRILWFKWIRSLSIWFLIFHLTESKIVIIILLLIYWVTFVGTSESYSIRIIAMDKKFNYWIVSLWIVFPVFRTICLKENISKLHFVIL